MKKTDFAQEIMTVSSLADYLHCHPSTVYRLLKERTIPAFKVGSDWRFQRAEFDQWIQKKQVVMPPHATGPKPAEDQAAREAGAKEEAQSESPMSPGARRAFRQARLYYSA